MKIKPSGLVSVPNHANFSKHVKDIPLSEEQKEMIRESWNIAMTRFGEETVGVLLYRNVFTLAPDVMSHFSFYPLHEQGIDVYRTKELKAHAKKVTTLVHKAVEHIDDFETLHPTLHRLGAYHVPRGTLPEHYPVVG